MKKIIVITLITLIAIVALAISWRFLSRPKLVDTGVAQLSKSFNDHNAEVWAVRFSPDGKLIATASVDSSVIIRDRVSGKINLILKHPAVVTGLDLSADGKYLVTSSYDSKLRLWDVAAGSLIRTFTGKTGTVWTVSFSPDCKTIAAAGDDKIITTWDINSGKVIHHIKAHERNIWAVKFSPDGKILASGSFDKKVKLWNAEDGTLIREISGHTQAVVDLAFSHDGKLLATTSDDKTIKLWNVSDGSIKKVFEVPEHIQAVAFSPDDKRLMTGGRDQAMIGELIQNFAGESQRFKGVSARLWDIEKEQVIQTFCSHANDVNDVAYSPDGLWIATCSADKTVELWRVMK